MAKAFLDQLKEANAAAVAERDRRRALKAWARARRHGDVVDVAATDTGGGHETPQEAIDAAVERALRPAARSKAFTSPAGIAFATLIALLILWPFALPAFDASNLEHVKNILFTSIIVTGLNVIAGYAGQLSLGQKIFWLVGGYTVAVLTTEFSGVLGDPWIAMVIAVLLAMGVGFILGLPALRVRGAYLAIVTLAFVPIFFDIFKSELFKGVFHGAQGISDVTSYVGNLARPPIRVIHYPFTNQPLTDLDFYIFTVALFGVMVFLVRNLVKSRWGRAMTSIRESEIAAKSSGVRVTRVKLSAFMLSAAYAAVGGILATYSIASIGPGQAFAIHIRDSFAYVVVMIVGGTGTLAGPVVGATTIEIIRTLTSSLLKLQTIILAVLALFTVITTPGGSVGAFRDAQARRRARKRPAEEIGPIERLPQPLVAPRPRTSGDVVASGDVVLETKNMSKIFGGLRANDTVSIAVRRGTVHSLIGPNGSGKTTFINVVTGVYQPEEGEVWFAGDRIDGKPAFVTVERGMGRTFQNLQLWRRMTVLENVMVGLHVRAESGMVANMIRTPRARREEARIRARAMGLLQFVGLDRFADVPAGALPYGPQRYLEIARALALDPTLLILDEPAAGLNPAEVGDLMRLIRRIQTTGITVFLIEHHMDLVMGVSDHISVLDYGKKISEGSPEHVQADERVIEAYLGAEFAQSGAH